MKILCDTCCILLILRIAPEMFTDDRFGCFTVKEIRDEIVQTHKLKTRYPWRTDYKDKIKFTVLGNEAKKSFEIYFRAIDNLVELGTINNSTNRFFDLSYIDRKIVAYSLATDSQLSTNDQDIRDFIWQHYDRNSISSLGLINKWLREGSLQWCDQFQMIIREWDTNNEPPQTREDIEGFERLSRFKYIGPR
jgi:hypothetical protein